MIYLENERNNQTTIFYLKLSVWAGTQKAVVVAIVGIIFCLSSSFDSDNDIPVRLLRQM